MKTLILTLLFPLTAFTGTLEVIGPCSSIPLFSQQVEMKEQQNVGDITIRTLTDHQVPHLGTEQGIQSIFNSPTGKEAIEILPDNEIRAYGWCYSVDGVEPGTYPNEEVITSKESHISWYFGFAHYKGGEWIAQCTKSFTIKPSFLCN